ncbi:MAG TPA: protein translocase subunit SecD [Longimicrobiales bacterium]|nr:protein translocase subunit SecD [Longimicrobiales bacterium]
MKSLRWRLIWVAALTIVSVFFLVPRTVTTRQYDAATGAMVDRAERRVPINLGLDLRGGVHLALEVDESKGPVADCADAIRRAEHIVRTRLDEFGTSERVVQVVGDCRLVVELPGVSDPARAREIVQRTAFLEFRLTDTRDRLKDALPAIDAAIRRGAAARPAGTAPAQLQNALSQPAQGDASADSLSATVQGLSGVLLRGLRPGEHLVAAEDVAKVERWLALPEVQRALPRGISLNWGAEETTAGGAAYRALYVLESRPIITGADLQDATAGHDPETNGVEVRFELTRAGGRKFGAATERNIGNFLAIMLDGRVQGAPPVIESRIEASGRIEMRGRSLQEANDLALVLRAGALPVPLQVVDQRMIGPSLGAESIRAGVQAALLSVLAVLLIIGVYYKLAGFFAVCALFLYILFCTAGLAAFGFVTLTLPGLAGFALSIGMAVDANVLIFERIREELGAKKTLRQAIDAGFRHAMSAIVDSNVTTALTALILYIAGTGPVRGFAVTLLIGLLASMISAIFVTRAFFEIWLTRKPKTLSFRSIPLLDHARWDIIGRRRWAYALSGALILPGLLLLFARGPSYSIEFTGGTLAQVQTAQPSSTGVLRAALAAGGVIGAEVQDFGSNRDFVVRAQLSEAQTSEAETDAIAASLRSALDRGLGSNAYELERTERVGPKVGSELQQKAWLAILLSFASTLIYLAFRFEWRYGAAAVLATAHDILATLAFISYLDIEISLVVVAGILTVLGYSLNDTIVIFDRVRERMRGARGMSFIDVLNASVNETLPRTVLTGGSALATALILVFFGGAVIKPFALVLAFGIVVGTFSSIFVAAPVLFRLSRGKARVRARSALPESAGADASAAG